MRLTAAGEAMLRQIQHTIDRERAGLLQRLSDGELLMLAELLEKVFATILDRRKATPQPVPANPDEPLLPLPETRPAPPSGRDRRPGQTG